jgi:CRISPR-associated protein Csm2
MNAIPGNYRRDRGDREPPANISTASIRFGAAIGATLYSDIAEAAARTIAEPLVREANKPSQLRRFYDELCMLQAKVGRDEERFKAQEPFVQMLKAKVAYARGRKKVDANFESLLRHVVENVKDCRSFEQAKLFMEAFMAFYKAYGPKD